MCFCFKGNYLTMRVMGFFSFGTKSIALGLGYNMDVKFSGDKQKFRSKMGKNKFQNCNFLKNPKFAQFHFFSTLSYVKSNFKMGHCYDIFDSDHSKRPKMTKMSFKTQV